MSFQPKILHTVRKFINVHKQKSDFLNFLLFFLLLFMREHMSSGSNTLGFARLGSTNSKRLGSRCYTKFGFTDTELYALCPNGLSTVKNPRLLCDIVDPLMPSNG